MFSFASQAVVLVYDVTDRDSFDAITDWMLQVAQKADPSACKVLIGNKCDLTGKVAVSEAEGRALAASYDMPFFLVSAKAGINVSEVPTRMRVDVDACYGFMF